MRNLIIIFTALTALASASASEAGGSPLHFVVENETFAKNIERTDSASVMPPEDSELLEGHTPTGNILKTYFHYQVNQWTFIQVGALLNLPFGQDGKVLTADPVISITHKFRPNWWYTFGTIDREHPVLDAMLDDIRAYDDPIEQGFQLQADSEHIRQDVWLDWRIKEEFDTHENFSIANYTQLKALGFMVDGQLIWDHFGGQRNTAPGVHDNLIYALGAGYTLYP